MNNDNEVYSFIIMNSRARDLIVVHFHGISQIPNIFY